MGGEPIVGSLFKPLGSQVTPALERVAIPHASLPRSEMKWETVRDSSLRSGWHRAKGLK